ncbi:MAG: hypothetical protein JWM35_1221 [Verrucomicrobia bacterium]|nr:hypothetical protein [Verrucomicrobiota bacterium]
MISYDKVLSATGEAGYLITVAESEEGVGPVWETHVLVPALNLSTSERPPVSGEAPDSTTTGEAIPPALQNRSRDLFWNLLSKWREKNGEPVPPDRTLSHQPITLPTLYALVRDGLVISEFRRIRNESASRDLREALTRVLSFSL